MRISYGDYNYRVCPYCNSKRLRKVGVVGITGNNYCENVSSVNHTGYICNNCQRYHVTHKSKYTYDRAEMRRDIKQLLEFLDKRKAKT